MTAKNYNSLKGLNTAYRVFMIIFIVLFMWGIFKTISALGNMSALQSGQANYFDFDQYKLERNMKNINNALLFGGMCFAVAWILWDIWLLIAHLNLPALNAQGTYPVWLVVLGFLIPGLAWVMPLLTLLQIKQVDDTDFEDRNKDDRAWKQTRIEVFFIFWWLLYWGIVLSPVLVLYVFPLDTSTPQGVNNLPFFYLIYFFLSLVWAFWAMSITKKNTEEQAEQFALIGGQTSPPISIT